MVCLLAQIHIQVFSHSFALSATQTLNGAGDSSAQRQLDPSWRVRKNSLPEVQKRLFCVHAGLVEQQLEACIPQRA